MGASRSRQDATSRCYAMAAFSGGIWSLSGRGYLKLYQLGRWRFQNGELRKFTAHHRHLIAVVEAWAAVAVLVELVGNLFPHRYGEPHAREKAWDASK